MHNTKYAAIDVVDGMLDGYKSCLEAHDIKYDADEILKYIKECCAYMELDDWAVKEIFDAHEKPFYYDFKEDKAFNGLVYPEEEDKEVRCGGKNCCRALEERFVEAGGEFCCQDCENSVYEEED